MASDSGEPIERWTAKRRVALVMSILKGGTSVAEAARTHGLTVTKVEDWREKSLAGADSARRSRRQSAPANTRRRDGFGHIATTTPLSVSAIEARAAACV